MSDTPGQDAVEAERAERIDHWSGASRRWDRMGLVEYRCIHGVGHPAVGSCLWIAEELGQSTDSDPLGHQEIHGCDGCCCRDDFPGTAIESLRKAHRIIRERNAEIRALHGDIADLSSEIQALRRRRWWQR